MPAECPAEETERLLRLSQEVTRVAAALAALSIGFAAPRPGARAVASGTDINPRTVDLIIQAFRARARYLPRDVFAEPAFDLLLRLFRCELRGSRVSARDLALEAAESSGTTLKWIATMIERKLLMSESDAGGSVLSLAPGTSAALRGYFAELVKGSAE